VATGILNIPDEFPIRRNDRLPPYQIDVFDKEGDALALLNVTSVAFTMRSRDGTLKIDRQPASVIAGGDGSTLNRLQYEWGASDTDTAGSYLAEFEVTFNTGNKRTFPATNEQRLRILIGDDLDAT
jgi:hypothetical protein